MKKIAILLLLCSCGKMTSDKERVSETAKALQVVRVRDCEYVLGVSSCGKSLVLCHAGDCDNPIHEQTNP